MKKISAVMIGAGERGILVYGPYALQHPDEIQFVAVAEPDVQKRERFQKAHGIPEDMCFSCWEELLQKDKLADVAFICTQDRMHFEPTLKALQTGYHVLLEKPMAVTPEECIIMGDYSKKYSRILSICHVLRFTKFYNTIKKLLDEGRIGSLISIQHNENVGYWHQAHSYVRGNWRNSETSSPMILAKSCHDMDILAWLVGADCVKVSSFGSLTHFKAENAPQGAPERCLDGCPAEAECPYHVSRIYLTENTGWPTSAISVDTSYDGRIKALKEGPYGRCVYRCDNNVVDHQVVNLEFANEVTVAFTMCAFTNEVGRTMKLMGTKGEIKGHMENNELEIVDFLTGKKEVISLNEKSDREGHGGGDTGIMGDFVRLVQLDGAAEGLTSAAKSVQSHLMAFAAEESRLTGKIVDLEKYTDTTTVY